MKPLPVIQPPPPKASAASPPQTAGLVDDPATRAELETPVVQALSTVFDPEIPVNIYDLGLIYEVILDASRTAGIRMTLTAPGCPAAQFLPDQVKRAVAAVPGLSNVKVDVVWDPPWSRDRMSDAAKLQLGLF